MTQINLTHFKPWNKLEQECDCSRVLTLLRREHWPCWVVAARTWGACVLLTWGLMLHSPVMPAYAQSVEWVAQLGTSGVDESTGVSADGLGNVYVSGYTFGDLSSANAGSSDAFVSKYDEIGNVVWTRQFGTAKVDSANGVTADGLGNVYVTGKTTGSLGGANAGFSDAFVSKYDAAGSLLWTRQFGTAQTDVAYDVSADGLGNVYISGGTFGSLGGANVGSSDAFVSKYDEIGDVVWTRQIGTNLNDDSLGVSADGVGNVYISGNTSGSLGGANMGSSDAFVSKYDAAGNLLWSQQLGTSVGDRSEGVAADDFGNVFIVGSTFGSLDGVNAGFDDAFVSKFDTAGNLLWTRQLGTISTDSGFDVAADGSGKVYISGYTNGVLGATSAGSLDAFVSNYDAAGNLLWTEQFGTAAADAAYGVAADSRGNVFVSGRTDGSLGGAHAGLPDGFVANIRSVPEPTSLVLLAIATIASARRRVRPSFWLSDECRFGTSDGRTELTLCQRFTGSADKSHAELQPT